MININQSKLKRWSAKDDESLDVEYIKTLLNHNQKMYREYLYLIERFHPINPRKVITHILIINKRIPQKFA